MIFSQKKHIYSNKIIYFKKKKLLNFYYSINVKYLFLIAVGIHFDYHDVDISYIHELMADFKKEYHRPYAPEVPAIMKLLEQRTYSSAESHLLEATKNLQLSINTD